MPHPSHKSGLGCKQGCTQPCSGGEGKFFQSCLECGCLISQVQQGSCGTRSSSICSVTGRLQWVLHKSSDWLYLSAQMKKRNKSSYQTCCTMLFYQVFSICSRMPTVNPVSRKTLLVPLGRVFPRSVGEPWPSWSNCLPFGEGTALHLCQVPACSRAISAALLPR